MRVMHKNSKEIFNLDEPKYCKFFGMYGMLIMTIRKEIYFIVGADTDDLHNITDEFEIIF
jgi:hypothetical protein